MCLYIYIYIFWLSVGNIPHSRGELIFEHLNKPTVTCYVNEVSARLGLWGLVLALALACVFAVGA
jgi:hypothetical protein